MGGGAPAAATPARVPLNGRTGGGGDCMTTIQRAGLALGWALLALAPDPAAAQAGATSGLAQAEPRNLLTRPALLHVERVPLTDALGELVRTSGVALAYSPSLLPPRPRLSCACKSLTVGEALAAILLGTGVTYREGAGEVILVPGEADRPRSAGPRLVSSAAMGVLEAERQPSPPPAPPAARVPAVIQQALVTGT